MERRTFNLTSQEGRRLQDVPGCTVLPRAGKVEVGADCFSLLGLCPTDIRRYSGRAVGLKPHQIENIDFTLRRGGALIGDPPGAGKTRSALQVAHESDGPLLVMGPAMSRGTWRVESKRWLNAEVLTLQGRTATPDALNIDLQSKIVFCNYEVARFWGPMLGAVNWGCVILDEVHRAKARSNSWVNGVAEALWQNTGPVVALSATPVWSDVVDLWRILSWVHPGAFGGYWDFARRYCGAQQGPYGWVLGAPTNTDELRQRLEFFYLRHEGATATPISRSLILLDDAPTREALAAGAVKLAEVIAKGGDLKSATLKLLGKATNAKIKALPQLLDDRPTLVAVHMVEATSKVASAIVAAGRGPVATITGAVPLERRQEVFNDPFFNVVVATRDSVRESIDGRRFRRLIVVDLAYVPDELVQLEGRLTRGQATPVHVDYVVIEASFDSALLEVLLKRLEARDSVLGESDQYRAVARVLADDVSDARLSDLAARIMENADADA